MLLEKNSEWEILYFIFDTIDELLKEVTPLVKKKLLGDMTSHGGQSSNLSLEAIISFNIFRYVLSIGEVKPFHRHLLCHYQGELGIIPNYQNFNRLSNQSLGWVIFVLEYLTHRQRQQEGLGPKFIDATPLKVCENQRIFDHRVCKGLAQRGKSSRGWFFGFKLHTVINTQGDLLSLCITPGNTDDRTVVMKLLKQLKGLAVADAGYLSKKLMQKLFEKGIFFLTDVKKNMKRLMATWQHEMLKMRQRVECSFSVLKYRLKAEASVARSPVGYFSRCLYACLTYIVQRCLTKKYSSQLQ